MSLVVYEDKDVRITD
jgi:hypothetical protein